MCLMLLYTAHKSWNSNSGKYLDEVKRKILNGWHSSKIFLNLANDYCKQNRSKNSSISYATHDSCICFFIMLLNFLNWKWKGRESPQPEGTNNCRQRNPPSVAGATAGAAASVKDDCACGPDDLSCIEEGVHSALLLKHLPT